METRQYIVIKRTVSITTQVPFTPNHYPNMTIEEAVQYEEEQELDEKLEQFSADLVGVEEKDIDFGEVITVEEL